MWRLSGSRSYRQILGLAQGSRPAREPAVVDSYAPFLSRLSTKTKLRFRACERDMAVLQGGKTVAAVGAREPDQGGLKEIHYGCQDLGQGAVGSYAAAWRGGF
jgi:hypothetical protein